MEVFILLLPVLWASLATIIGLVLYKSSEALFEQENVKDSSTRRIRLVGSVVIAGAAFGAMYWATPRSSLELKQKDAKCASSSRVDRLTQDWTDLRQKVLDLQACLASQEIQTCQAKSQDLQANVTRVENAIQNLYGGVEATD
jgi:hypothetical protein